MKSTSFPLVFLVLALAGIAPGADADPATSVESAGGWIKHPGNPVLGGKLGTCFDVAVLREGDR